MNIFPPKTQNKTQIVGHRDDVRSLLVCVRHRPYQDDSPLQVTPLKKGT